MHSTNQNHASSLFKAMFSVGIVLGAAMTAAADIYVDAAAQAEGADGTSERPYATIQDAVDAAQGGDVIRVAEGVYTNGMKLVSGCSYARVHISDKPGLKLIGAGRGKSFIVGSRDPSTVTYDDVLTETRTNLVRCVYVNDSDGTVIEGFTLSDGETFVNLENLGNRNGGGLLADSADVYLVDCDVLRCCARIGGAIYYGTAVRCLIEGNYAVTSTSCRNSKLFNCIIRRNRSTGSYAIANCSELYNCTVFDNMSFSAFQNSCVVRNCVAGLSSNSEEYGSESKNEEKTPDDIADSVLASTAVKGWRQFLAPALDDLRLLSTSDAVGAGLASHLSSQEVPDGIDLMKDFTGATIIRDDSGRINAGAIQATVTPAGGALAFAEGTFTVNGCTTSPKYATYAYPEFYPTQFCVQVVLGEGEELYRLERYDPATREIAFHDYPSAVPQLDGKMWLMPPLSADVIITNKAVNAEKVLWVDKENGSDDWGDDITDAGSSARPYATIQKAVDSIASDEKAVVNVLPGTYDTGVTTNGTYGTFRLHVDGKDVRIRAVQGPSVTVISGAPDLETAENGTLDAGLGTNAVKCVFLGGEGAYLQGFTLANGYTDSSAATDHFGRGSAIVSGARNNTSDNMSTVTDCVVSNCRSRLQNVYYAKLLRCRFVDCVTTDSAALICGGMAWACYGNRCTITCGNTTGFINGNAEVWQSTFVGEPKSGKVCSTANVSYNSIWDGGTYLGSACVFTNSIAYNIGYVYGTEGFSQVDPLFLSRDVDGVLCSDSPAVGMGESLASYGFAERFWRVAGGDVNGDPLVFTDGKCTLGAFQTTRDVVRLTVEAPENGGWTLADGTDYGEVVLPEGGSLEIVPAAGERPCIGISCGGKDFFFTNAPNETVTLGYDVLAGFSGSLAVSGIYSTDWYVDDDGDDGNTGFLPTRPKRTLATAASLLAEGDTLWVFPGIYDEGGAFHTEECLGSRVVVKAGTSVVSLEGAAKTFIVGSSATQEKGDEYYAQYGTGSDAVRCAYVGRNALLNGFTLTGGRVYINSNEAYQNGAGVFGPGRDANASIANCVISNNIAYLGTTFKVDLHDCLVCDNITLGAGSGARQVNAYNSCFTRNTGSTVLSYMRDIHSTTVAGDNVNSSGSVPFLVGNLVNGGTVYDSLFIGKLVLNQSGDDHSHVSNVVCSVNSTFNDNATTGNVYMVDFDTQEFIDGVIPVAGANAAVDAADGSLSGSVYSDTDLRGFQRVMNGRRDIGAYEADWRGHYASTLCSVANALEIDAASPGVVKEGATVTIRSGSLEGTWYNATGKNVLCDMPVHVTGNGVLTVTLDGETLGTVTSSDGQARIAFTDKAPERSLVFTYVPGENDEGKAVIGGFTRSRLAGLVFTVR